MHVCSVLIIYMYMHNCVMKALLLTKSVFSVTLFIGCPVMSCQNQYAGPYICGKFCYHRWSAQTTYGTIIGPHMTDGLPPEHDLGLCTGFKMALVNDMDN